jgi:hypothetical protein
MVYGEFSFRRSAPKEVVDKFIENMQKCGRLKFVQVDAKDYVEIKQGK